MPIQYQETPNFAANAPSDQPVSRGQGFIARLRTARARFTGPIWPSLRKLMPQSAMRRRVRTSMLVALIVLMSFVGTSRTGFVMAASATYSPAYCLGGWHNPQRASGSPDLGVGAQPSDFTGDNSALLDGTVAQLYCGYFAIEAQEHPPQQVRLTFSWQVTWPTSGVAGYAPSGEAVPIAQPEPAAVEAPAPVEPLTTPAEPSPEPGPQSWLPFSVGVAHAQETTAADATPSVPPADVPAPAPAPEASAAPAEPKLPAAVSATPLSDVVQEQPSSVSEQTTAPAPDSQPITAPIDAAPEQPAPAPETSTPPAAPVVEVPAATPQEQPSSGAFAQVSYSVSGNDWHSLGRVTASTWAGFSADIPVSSWQDLQNLQVTIVPLPSLDLQPTIYLDGMTAEVDYDRTITEAITDLSDTIGDLVAAVFDAVAEPTQQLVDSIQQSLQQVSTEPEPTPVPVAIVPPPTPPPVPVPTLMFTVGGSVETASTNLPWLSVSDVLEFGGAKAVERTVSDAPAVAQSASPSLVVSGACHKAYGVVLLYHRNDDYLKNPSNFVFNRALPCNGSLFSYDLKQLPVEFTPGNYYLLLAEEGETGPWLPTSGIVPITIDRTYDRAGTARPS